MTSFVDSNVLVYLVDQDAPEKKAVAQQLLQREGSAGDLVLSTQVLQEFYVTVTRKLERPLKPEVALEAVEKFRTLPLVIVDDDIIISAIKRGQRDSIPFWDCLTIEAALKGGAQRLWSEDLQHGRTFGGMRVENP
ncbi:MAG TPA: PIN domain-containing protein, partial [Terriglobia bacterium]|nr:PIN domain-containing protein [Terriglobia bacterium]